MGYTLFMGSCRRRAADILRTSFTKINNKSRFLLKNYEKSSFPGFVFLFALGWEVS